MTRLITRVVFSGTKVDYAIGGKNVDCVMKRLRKKKDWQDG